MNRPTRVYFTFIIGVAIATLGFQPWASVILPNNAWYGWLALVGLGIISEILTVHVTIGTRAAGSSIAFVPLISAALLFPSPLAMLAAVAIISVAQFAVHKRELLRGLFNVAQGTLAAGLAGLVFVSLGGSPGSSSSISILNFIGLAGSFFFANQLLVATAIALMQGERFASTFTRVVSAAGGNFLYDLLVSPIAGVLAVLYMQIGVAGIILVFFPLLLVRHAYSSIQKLQQVNKDVLNVLVKTIETRDPYTSGHSVRVAHLAKAIAEDLDLQPFKIDEVETAALVHDIGKIDAIYSDLIQKESSLTDAERRVIITHAAKGAEFLRTLSSFRESVILAVRHHHERYDGTGYPDRLAGEDIPLAARIIMLCDSIDAMLSDRPYRRALSVEQVRSELVRCSGSQFDPRIVQAILKRNTLERAAQLAAPAVKKYPLSVAV